MVTMWLLLGAVKALLRSASNNEKAFRELLILAERRAMKTDKRKLYLIHPMADDGVLWCSRTDLGRESEVIVTDDADSLMLEEYPRACKNYQRRHGRG